MWKEGKINGYKWQAKVFEEGSMYGIDGGRISKLAIYKDGKCIFNYDRGEDFNDAPRGVLAMVMKEATK